MARGDLRLDALGHKVADGPARRHSRANGARRHVERRPVEDRDAVRVGPEALGAALAALLAGLGMQGSGWDKMTARHLYHIVRALDRVGLNAEARMIAAEAVARG